MAGVLAAGMLAGCGAPGKIDGTKTVATVNGTQIPLGVVSLSARMTQASYASFYQMFGQSISWSSVADETTGETNGESLRNGALEQIELLYLLREKAADYGIELTEEDNTRIAEAAEAFFADNTDEAVEALGVTAEQVKTYLSLETIQHRMEEALAKEANIEVDRDTARQASFTYVSITIPEEERTETEAEDATADTTEAEGEEVSGEDETEETTEAVTQAVEESEEASEEASEDAAEKMTEAEAEAVTQTMEAAEESSEDTEVVSEEASEETTEDSRTAMEKAEELLALVKADPTADLGDLASQVDSALYDSTGSFTYTATDDEHFSDSYDDALLDALRTLDNGQVYDGVIRTDDRLYIVRMDNTYDEEATDTKVEDVREEMEDEYYTEKTDAWKEEAEIKVMDKVLKTLEVSDFVTFTFVAEDEEAESEDISEEVSEEMSAEAVTVTTTGSEADSPVEEASEAEAAVETTTEAE